MYIELCTNTKKIQDGRRKCEKRIIFLVVFCDFTPKIFELDNYSYRIQNEHKAMIENFYSHTYNQKSIILKKIQNGC